jgi:hypothetical protein
MNSHQSSAVIFPPAVGKVLKTGSLLIHSIKTIFCFFSLAIFYFCRVPIFLILFFQCEKLQLCAVKCILIQVSNLFRFFNLGKLPMGYFLEPTLRFSYNIYTQNRQITDGKVKCLFTECFYVNRIAPTKRTGSIPPISHPKEKKRF